MRLHVSQQRGGSGYSQELAEFRRNRLIVTTVFLCTSPLTGSRWCVPEKLAWVENHLGASWLDRIIIAKDKTLAGDRARTWPLQGSY